MTASLHGQWNFPTSIRFGCETRFELGAICDELGVDRPLLVTDRGVASLPIVLDLLKDLEGHGLGITVFNDVDPNPTDINVDNGVRAFRDRNCNGVIALGGGSGLDVGKAVALMVGQDRPIGDFEDVGDNWKRVNADGMVPCVALPTTAGTGSEVGRASVIVDTAVADKKIIFHPGMMPDVVIADPELTRDLPANLTAATGLDAFTHCFEAYCAPGFHPMADGIALQGMRLIARSLGKACTDGTDMLARAQMLAAASMGAVAFQKGLGAVHAISHSVGARYNTHHGLTNAVFLPYVMVRNRQGIEDRMGEVAIAVGLDANGFDAVLEWVLEFRATLGIPPTAASLGVLEEDLDELARRSLRDPALAGNPLDLGEPDLRDIIRRAVDGDIVG